jgi:hypothetical protein
LKLADRNKTAPAANHCSQQASNSSQDKKHNYHYSQEKIKHYYFCLCEAIFEDLCYAHAQKLHQQAPRSPLDAQRRCTRVRLLIFLVHRLYLHYAMRRCDIIFRPRWLYFASVVRPVAWSLARLVVKLCRATGCLVSLRGSSSTTSPMLCDRVPRLVAWLVVDLVPSHHSTNRRSN